ncbi:hypothetical protein BM1_03159 [Bipolaris maydis]|nr:hypothetical protein BM1_03159 [Bipolaris maydis]
MADRKQPEQTFTTNSTEEQMLPYTIEETSDVIQEAKRHDESRSMHCPDTPYLGEVFYSAIWNREYSINW